VAHSVYYSQLLLHPLQSLWTIGIELQ